MSGRALVAPRAELPSDEATAIRELAAQGYPAYELSRSFGLSLPAVQSAILGCPPAANKASTLPPEVRRILQSATGLRVGDVVPLPPPEPVTYEPTYNGVHQTPPTLTPRAASSHHADLADLFPSSGPVAPTPHPEYVESDMSASESDDETEDLTLVDDAELDNDSDDLP